ncbi:MAG TPA: 23S rRNA (pseudouridine(1915)-N(3))-methyltransferase RlmH [Flavobacteriales bacterium]|nr:23S rRNA (pseudouridine(1915)-N(3))-methyltransferase RlmH [Flavobacteriales bacterium]
MKIRLLYVGRTHRGPMAEITEEYLARLRRTIAIEEVVVAEAGKGDPAFQQRTECERILAALRPGERVVALDERGKQWTSPKLAEQLGRWRDQGTRQIVFVVGGAYGLNEEVRAKADVVLALSAMTFPHQLVRPILAEQIYRAFTILGGTPYHH